MTNIEEGIDIKINQERQNEPRVVSSIYVAL